MTAWGAENTESAAPQALRIRLFGALEIEDGSRVLGPRDLGGARPKQVLEILLPGRGHLVPTDLVELDLDRFDELVERSAREPTHEARRSLEQALELARGEVLEDEPYALWALDLRGTYKGRVLGAHLEAADAALAELDYAAALAHAEKAAALDRFSERAHRTAMLALYALGLAPTAETRALEAAVLREEDVRSLLPRPIVWARRTGGARAVRLLGRERELDMLERAAREALEGSFALLLVEGEAGVGKTRLLDELATSLAGTRVGRWSCAELERHLAYVPLAGALRDALDGIELDPRRRPALARILPELVLEQRREFADVEAIEALAEVIAEQAPLVLLIDDLHWADPATVAALSYLRRRCA